MGAFFCASSKRSLYVVFTASWMRKAGFQSQTHAAAAASLRSMACCRGGGDRSSPCFWVVYERQAFLSEELHCLWGD